jgi:hypothetical protein
VEVQALADGDVDEEGAECQQRLALKEERPPAAAEVRHHVMHHLRP